jgi:uncharacterized protein YebE (UPF0316 family)
MCTYTDGCRVELYTSRCLLSFLSRKYITAIVYLIEMLCIVVIIPHLSHKYMKNTQLSVVSTKVIDLINNEPIVKTRTPRTKAVIC